MIKGKRQIKKTSQNLQLESVRQEMNVFQPETELGKTLLEISRRNLERNETLLDAEEVMMELGRGRYE